MEQRKKENIKSLLLLIMGILALLITIAGAAYAYYKIKPEMGNININPMTSTTDNLTFNILPGEISKDTTISINATQENFAKGKDNLADDIKASATLMANNTTNKATMYYNVYLRVSINNFEYTQGEDTPELFLEVDGPENFNKEIVGLKKVTLNSENDSYDITKTIGIIKIAEKVPITASGSNPIATATDTWTVKITLKNLNADQSDNANKKFKGELILQSEDIKLAYHEKCNIENSISCQVAKKIFYDGNLVNDVLFYHDGSKKNEDGTIIDANDNSYRYSGANNIVNNYVCFGNDICSADPGDPNYKYLYRIIGLFDDEKNEQYKLKLIKADYVTAKELGDDVTAEGGAYKLKYLFTDQYYKGDKESYFPTIAGYNWNTADSLNDWSKSNLNTINLNDYYLNTFLGQGNIIDSEEENKWQKMIEKHKWITGGNVSANITMTNVYNTYYHEILKPVVGSVLDVALNFDTYVGLLYVSDYGYAASMDFWNTQLTEYNNAKDSNWLHKGLYEWTITRYSNSDNYAYIINENGSMFNYDVNNISYSIRPVIYLETNVNIYDGNGTPGNPYKLVLES